MAEYNSVPLGQAGTGAAFILPESQAANSLLETIDYNRQIEEQNRILRQQQAQQLAADWQKNRLKVEGGLYWQPEFEKRYENHLQKGIKLRQMGINPYRINPNDPNQVAIAQDYLLERQGIEADIAARKEREAAISEQMKALKSDPTAFRPKTVKAINDYINLPFSQAKGMQVPVLEKAFNREEELYKLADPITISEEKIVKEKDGKEYTVKSKVMDKGSTRSMAETILRNNSRGKNFIEDEIGVSIDEVTKYPDTLEDNLKLFTAAYEGDPKLRDQWAIQYGITSPEQAKPLIQQLATERYTQKKKYNTLLDDFEKRAAAKVDPTSSKIPYFGNRDQQLQEQAARRAEESARRERARFNWWNLHKDDDKKSGTVVIGNTASFTPVIKQSGKVELEPGAAIFSQNFNNESVTVRPSVVVDLKTGHAKKNSTPFDMKVGGAVMLPVFKNLKNDPRNDAEISLRQFEEILTGKHKTFKLGNITFKPFVQGTRTVKDDNGDIRAEGISVPYDAVKGNKNVPTEQFDKTVEQFNEAINSHEFRQLSAEQRLAWFKQQFNLK